MNAARRCTSMIASAAGCLGRFVREEAGPTAIEYAFLLALIATALTLTVNSVGTSSKAVFESFGEQSFGDGDFGGDSTSGPPGGGSPGGGSGDESSDEGNEEDEGDEDEEDDD